LEDFKDRAQQELNGDQWITLMRLTMDVWKAHYLAWKCPAVYSDAGRLPRI
jgi:hypothetical protein